VVGVILPQRTQKEKPFPVREKGFPVLICAGIV